MVGSGSRKWVVAAAMLLAVAGILMLVRSSLLPSGADSLVFDSTQYNAGVIRSTRTGIEHDFTFTNATSRPVRVLGVRSSCGCTVLKLTSDVVAPGERGSLHVTMRLGTVGPNSADVLVQVAGQDQPTRLRMLAEYMPDGFATARPERIVLQLLEGVTGEFDVDVFTLPGKHVELAEASSSLSGIDVSLGDRREAKWLAGGYVRTTYRVKVRVSGTNVMPAAAGITLKFASDAIAQLDVPVELVRDLRWTSLPEKVIFVLSENRWMSSTQTVTIRRSSDHRRTISVTSVRNPVPEWLQIIARDPLPDDDGVVLELSIVGRPPRSSMEATVEVTVVDGAENVTISVPVVVRTFAESASE